MTAEITRINQAALPVPSELQQIELGANAVRKLYERFYVTDQGAPALRRLVTDIDRALESVETLRQQLDALGRPATKRELADRLSVLRLAFPNAKADDAFGRILIEHVAGRTPTFGQLDWAVRHLIDTSVFLPSVAQVQQALTAAQDTIEASKLLVDRHRLERLRSELSDRIDEQ